MPPPGLELLFSTVKNDIQSKDDALIVAIHWCLISNNFKCVGKGENAPATPKESELLPKEWNSSSDHYALLYARDGQCYLLKVIKLEDTLLVNFMRSSDSVVTDLSMATSDFVADDLSDYQSAYKDVSYLHTVVKSGLVQKFDPKPPTPPAPTQAIKQEDDRRYPEPDPLRVGPRLGGRREPEWGERSDPFSVGRADLDPLAAGVGGGMLMDPFRGGGRLPNPDAGLPQRLPRGAVPPGARFDPFGPANPERFGGGGSQRPGPDPDHLPPPGYDDMFM